MNDSGPRQAHGSRGSASVVVVSVVGVVAAVALAGAAAGGLSMQRAQARAGADLSALAGAVAARDRAEGGSGQQPCAAAQSTAEANAVTLVACVVTSNGAVWVEVRASRATARARAGPAWTN